MHEFSYWINAITYTSITVGNQWLWFFYLPKHIAFKILLRYTSINNNVIAF